MSDPGKRRGFTLLEVLAAVAVVALVYWSLLAAAIDGGALEGDARRRLRAGLIADRTLGEMEAALAAGVAPQLGVTESEEEPYRIEIEVKALSLDELAARARAVHEKSRGGGKAYEPALLVAPARGPAPLVSIDVRVSWAEGIQEVDVRRTTFGFDVLAAEPFLAPLAEAAAAAEAAADAGRTDEGAREGSSGEPGTSGRRGRQSRGEPFRAREPEGSEP